ncbi:MULTISPECIES: fimbrial protein [Lelliottia]|uniref:Fimbrial protein n=1 Tax=Lelliottia wanjuensis TaxID=3050585 RepID=A0AAP4LDH1_9ENTR|nr:MULTISPECIES: fimbrial protein [unclassified Lelliottia]MDK9366332.1 fimbrial protein [Lelliottia sp. V106_12]MDK9582833.1 fimbrial protein [Lelliottia sp. V86_10]MDK9615969.1 fimbrial protein [Lelliottia sp. V106_9]
MSLIKSKLIIFAACIIMSSSVFAQSCKVATLRTSKAASGSVVVQRDAPVGTIIFEGATQPVSDYADGCDTNVTLKFSMTYMSATKSAYGEHVYDTNVPGVGIIFATSGQAQTYFDNPANILNFNVGTGGVMNWDGGNIKYIKTGPIGSGTLAAGTLGELALLGFDGAYHTAIDFNMDAAVITSLACSITTPKLTFPLGTVPVSEFGETIGFTPVETNSQNLGLDCDADANINVQLSGTQNPDVSDASVLALNGQGTDGVASGLGVQLLYNDAPLKINESIVMKKSAGGQEMLPIVARYYQTKSTVMPGDASTSATLTLTYQ